MAMNQINEIGLTNAVLFVVNEKRLIGSLSDGDIRRALLKGVQLTDSVLIAVNKECKYESITNKLSEEEIKNYKVNGIEYLPVIDLDRNLISIKDINNLSYPILFDVFMLAGGKGERLLPLTKETPKPMLYVGEKPIIEHNIDRLIKFGANQFNISINYLGNKISDYFGNGTKKKINVTYITEDKPLGTIGSLCLVTNFVNDYILVINSDLLTNINYADFFDFFLNTQADIAVAAIPYHVDVPYAILETNEDEVIALTEKPRYTYYANAGIYLIKKSLISKIPNNSFYNATDLIEKVISENGKVARYVIHSYWLDIGKMNDFNQAQKDIKHLDF